MNEKVITVSAGEVGSLIGVAAAEVSFEKQMSDEEALRFMENTAEITNKLLDHLSGRRKFNEEHLALSLIAQMMCGLFVGGGSTCSPESVEEE